MDDVNRLLGEAMRAAADRAPSDVGLLDVVHRRSDRLRRRRVATGLSAVAVVVALAVPVTLAVRPQHHTAPLGGLPTPSAQLPTPPASPAPAPSSSPPPSPSASPSRAPAGAVQFVGGYTAPTFPYTLPPTSGMKAPVASMSGGNPVAFFEATELRQHADITVTVSSRRPTFSTVATETSTQVRGHAGTLRTVDVQPAKQLTVYWQESASRWIQLATDDTYPPAQVVALAGSLSPASIAVLPPFRLDRSPAGLVPYAVTASTMSFRPATGTGEFACVLHKRRQLATTNERVGAYDALLTHDATGVTLDVDITDWDATLEVTVTGGLTVGDTDLLRFAGGVHVLDRSNPA